MSDENQSAGPASDIGNLLAGTALGALLSGNGAADRATSDRRRLLRGLPCAAPPLS